MIYGFLAAILFGMSPPLCKLLLGWASPLALASLLYLGAGVGLLSVYALRRAFWHLPSSPPPRGREWSLLAGAVVCGSILAPFLLMLGLGRTPASTASLLLNLELVATALLAWTFFKEGFERRVGLGMAGVLAGCVALSWPSEAGWNGWAGPAAIAGACALWGMDNNFTQGLAERDPLLVAGLKGLAGGAVNGLIAMGAGQAFPKGTSLGACLIVGFICYGLSLVFFVLSLRRMGTARTVALFSLAPFAGAGLSFVLLGEAVSPSFLVGLVLVAAGLAVTLVLRHEHPHTHDETDHEHLHIHDEHHDHRHGVGTFPEEPHVHRHHHEFLVHLHPHFPDSHHRHGHPNGASEP